MGITEPAVLSRTLRQRAEDCPQSLSIATRNRKGLDDFLTARDLGGNRTRDEHSRARFLIGFSRRQAAWLQPPRSGERAECQRVIPSTDLALSQPHVAPGCWP